MNQDEDGFARANGGATNIRSMLSLAEGWMNSVSEAAQGGLEKGVQRLEHAQAAVLDKGKEVATTADDYVHEHPWKAVGIAAGVGLVVGLWLARR